MQLEALHNIGSSGDWARKGMLGAAARERHAGTGEKAAAGGGGGGGGGGAPVSAAVLKKVASVDAARLLARKSFVCMIHAALPLAKRGYPETDHDGGRCLIRACAWIVSIRNATETEDAVHHRATSHTTSRSPVCIPCTPCTAQATASRVPQVHEALSTQIPSDWDKGHSTSMIEAPSRATHSSTDCMLIAC